MVNKEVSERYIYTLKVGELFLKSHLSSGVAFTKSESEAYKISLYSDDRDEDKIVAKEHIRKMHEKLNLLGFNDFVLNKKTVKNEVSERVITLAELQDKGVIDNEVSNNESPSDGSTCITFNVSSITGNDTEIDSFAKNIAESLKRQRGLR